MSITRNLVALKEQIPAGVALVAVSKFKPAPDLEEAYAAGQRDFGENYVQELVEKEAQLPKDIRWHFIGHLQSNKVKYIAPFVHLIHSVDSAKLLKEVQKQGQANQRVISCLLQIHIAEEDTKSGFSPEEVLQLVRDYDAEAFSHVAIVGLMGMGTFTDDAAQTRREFQALHRIYVEVREIWPQLTTLSMGMSGDWQTAVEEGSTLVRIGSTIFGARN
jgi:pyridoxal phosphate enzyme (YggS family)